MICSSSRCAFSLCFHLTALLGGLFTSRLRPSFHLQILFNFPFFLSLLRARLLIILSCLHVEILKNVGFFSSVIRTWIYVLLVPFISLLTSDFCFASFYFYYHKKPLLVTCSSVNGRLWLNSGHSHFPCLPWWVFRAVSYPLWRVASLRNLCISLNCCLS